MDESVSRDEIAQYFTDVFPEEAVREEMMNAIGASLNEQANNKEVYLCVGSGSNGKTFFFQLLQRMLGSSVVQLFEDRMIINQSSVFIASNAVPEKFDGRIIPFVTNFVSSSASFDELKKKIDNWPPSVFMKVINAN